MTPAARLTASIELLAMVQETARPADQVASNYFKGRRYIGAKDRRAVAEVIWRVLRHRARLNWWLEHLEHEDRSSRALVFADMGLQCVKPVVELFHGMHAIDMPSSAERRLWETMFGRSIFHHEMPSWVRSECPEWIIPRLTELFGDNLLAEMGAMRDEAPVDLRVNTLKATRESAAFVLDGDKVPSKHTALSPICLRLEKRAPLVQLQAWREGLVEVQDEGSQLVALLTDPKPGMTVIDYCAGAGGKTLALAARMENKGRLVASDVAEWRVDRAQDRLRRAGVHNVTRRVLTGESDKWIKRAAGSFDRVLVDAPCTGTGTWRRNPDAKWQLTENTIQELVVRQAAILASASRLVKPGGRLVYATCSLLPEENERQVEAFLSTHPEFTPIPVTDIWPEAVGTPCPVPGPWLRLSPLNHGTDGFFAAIMERRAAE